MSPPELPAHAPGLDIVHPVVIRLRPVLRHEARAPVLDRRARRLRQRRRIDIPLVRHPRLNHHARPVAKWLFDLQVLDPLQQARRLKRGNHRLACLEPVQPAQLYRNTRRIGFRAVHDGCNCRQDVQRRMPRALAHFKVIEVMRRRDLHRARTLLGVRIFIRHDRNPPPDDRQHNLLADEPRIPRILRMHRHAGIAQHRLRPRRRDHDIVARLERDVAVFILERMIIGHAVRQRITQVPVMPRHFAGLDFEVRNRRLEMRVPVHQPLVAVDQALLVQVDEHFRDRLRQALVHREPLDRPVARGAQPLQLPLDRAAGLFLPRPDALQERLASHGAAVLVVAFLRQLALNHHLRRDARMVGARLPQHILAAHPLEPDQHILQRIVERMAHVQHAGHVRRRDHDRIGLRAGIPGRAEAAGFLPGLVDPGFGFGGVKSLVKHRLAGVR